MKYLKCFLVIAMVLVLFVGCKENDVVFEGQTPVSGQNGSQQGAQSSASSSETESYDFNQKETDVNLPDYLQISLYHQEFINNEHSEAILETLVTAEGKYPNARYDGFAGFSDISAADKEYLIYCALLPTEDLYTGWITFGDGYVESENPQNPVVKTVSEIYLETGKAAFLVKKAKDVEKVFHFIYGEQIPFEPCSLGKYDVDYIPEEDIFIQYNESIGEYNIPQIISIEEDSGVYTVEVVWTSIFDYVEAGVKMKLDESIDRNTLLKSKKTTYLLAADGNNFYITGILN